MAVKPGYYTTEFWVTVATDIVSILNMSGAWNFTANKWSVLALAVVNGAYALARGLAKRPAHVAPVPVATPPPPAAPVAPTA